MSESSLKSLENLHREHAGRVSDKWSSYLSLYEQEFQSSREKARAILEIGVQNGGSLEVWAKYFPNVRQVIGCDIDPLCAALTFDDPRIRVIVGDATDGAVRDEVVAHASEFDIVIDDGSHIPADVVNAFFLYWPHVRPGGLFVAEDLACDYFPSHQGSIKRADTANRFFAQLVHLISQEHWQGVVQSADLFSAFAVPRQVDWSKIEGSIQSISFHNSVVIVRKAVTRRDTELGDRVVVGRVADVDDAVLTVSSAGSASLLGLHEPVATPPAPQAPAAAAAPHPSFSAAFAPRKR